MQVQLTSRAAAAAAAGESRTEHPCPRDSNATTLPNARYIASNRDKHVLSQLQSLKYPDVFFKIKSALRFISSMMHKAQDGPDLHVTHLLTQMGQVKEYVFLKKKKRN